MEAIWERFRQLRIAVVGDVILDHYIWGTVDRIAPEAPVPLLDVSGESHRLGGAGNVALNLSRLGIRVSLSGRVGDDPWERVCTTLLGEAGIEWLGGMLGSSPGTILKTRVVAQNQQLCRLDREGRRGDYAIGDPARKHLVAMLLEKSDAILLSDYAKGVIDNALLGDLREGCREREIPLYCDPKPKRWRDFSGLDLLTPNRMEAVVMSGMEWDPKDAYPAEEIVAGIEKRYGPRHLVITLGPEGMLYAEGGRIGGIVPASAREVYDVSGAGDTVIAVLSAALLAGADLETSVRLANVAAGVVVGKLGTASLEREDLLAAWRHREGRTDQA
ncbi:MAG: PfkB family carbohydrate kinase [Oceanipulchritudo sp.]